MITEDLTEEETLSKDLKELSELCGYEEKKVLGRGNSL